MPPEPAPWKQEKFVEKLEIWVATEHPPADLRILVASWVFTRYDDPYADLRPEPGLPGMWFGKIPGTDNGLGQAVACACWIDDHARTVRCDSIASLNTPI